MNSAGASPRLVLASTSQARKSVLTKLKIPFETFAPSIDESVLSGESPTQLVERLSLAKARKVSKRYPSHLIIGSDQIAVVAGQMVGKPQNREDAIGQLTAASGETVTLFTGIALLNSETGNTQLDVLPYRVVFRELNQSMIENYIDRDQPFDCGGSLRSEGLGIVLLKEFDGSDPNILLGLPLIRLIDMLANESFHPLKS